MRRHLGEHQDVTRILGKLPLRVQIAELTSFGGGLLTIAHHGQLGHGRVGMHLTTCAVAAGSGIVPLALAACYPHHDEPPMRAEPHPRALASAPAAKSVGTSAPSEPAIAPNDAGPWSQNALDGGPGSRVNGRLPPAVIQRVVRLHFGRFRLCYENGMRENPNLQGRVTVKFVIDRSGAVAMTADAGSDLPDQGVVQCIVRGFGDLTFPQPDGGMLTVVYPIIFKPGGAADSGVEDGGSQSLADRYTFEVQVVDQAPSELFLLSRFSEPAGDSCTARLLEHARGLGANRLFIDRTATCSGSAYFVRPGLPERSPKINASLRDWLRARWRRPPSISAEESAHLCVVVQFSASPLRRVWRVNGQPIRSSGNRAFDDSVVAALESAIDERATVPAPPRDAVGEYVEYRIEFTEGDPSRCWVER